MKVGDGEMGSNATRHTMGRGSGQREDVAPPGGSSHIPPLHLLPTQCLPLAFSLKKSIT